MIENTMKYKGYTAAIHYDYDDGILVGRVLDINDIIDFHGDSVNMLRKEFHVAIDEYSKACEKMGQRSERPSSDKRATK